MRFSISTLAFAAAVSAQTFTDCDPTKKDCPKDVGLPSSSFSSDFTLGPSSNASWSAAAYSTIDYTSNGAEFSIAKEKQAPTIETNFNIFFGRVDVKMKAAKGRGIVSSIVLESADLDEIDWEFVGADTTRVQSNFYGKGNTTTYDRVIYHPVSTPQDLFHTYSIDWTAERLQFLIDGTLVRTVQYSEPKTLNGKNYPQTPMKLKLGNWCGGCEGSNEGTVQWAGGKTTFEGAPYVMYVDSVSVKNYNPADAYEWTDRSGSWQSIRIINDGSASQPTGGSDGGNAPSGGSTSAPTSSHSVGNIHISQTPSVTLTGSAYSMNSASVSAQNSGRPTGAYGSSGNGSSTEGGHGGMGAGAGSGDTTLCTDDSPMPTGASVPPAGGNGGSGLAAGSTFTSMTVIDATTPPVAGTTGGAAPPAGANGTVVSPSGPAQQTGNAASSLTVASGSLVGVLFGMLFL